MSFCQTVGLVLAAEQRKDKLILIISLGCCIVGGVTDHVNLDCSLR